jgi:heme-degrading monooxygenase HmoA
MFYHTVLLRFSPTATEDLFSAFADFEATIRSSCSGVRTYRLLPNAARSSKGFTHALFSVFDSRDAFRAYERSAIHHELKAFLHSFVRILWWRTAATANYKVFAGERIAPEPYR